MNMLVYVIRMLAGTSGGNFLEAVGRNDCLACI